MSKEKVTMSASDISSKWNKNMKNAVTDIQAGIDRVTTNPMEKAIAKQDKMKANLNAAIDNGTWAKQMGKVSMSDWKTKTKTKVGERLSSGVDGAMNKRKEFDNWLVGRINSGLDKVNAMPDMTLQDSINRAAAMMTHMASEKYKAS